MEARVLLPLVVLHMPAGRVRDWASAVIHLWQKTAERPTVDGLVHWGYLDAAEPPAGWPLMEGRWIVTSPLPAARWGLPPSFTVFGIIPPFMEGKSAAAALQAVASGFRVTPVNEARPPRLMDEPARGGLLSARERRIMEELARGESNKSIAYKLGLSESTVRFHVKNIFAKLGAQNRAQAVYRAVAKGFLVI